MWRLRHKRCEFVRLSIAFAFVLEQNGSKSRESAIVFEWLLEKAKPAAHKEFAGLTAFAELDGIDQLEKWDGAYYSEELKQNYSVWMMSC